MRISTEWGRGAKQARISRKTLGTRVREDYTQRMRSLRYK